MGKGIGQYNRKFPKGVDGILDINATHAQFVYTEGMAQKAFARKDHLTDSMGEQRSKQRCRSVWQDNDGSLHQCSGGWDHRHRHGAVDAKDTYKIENAGSGWTDEQSHNWHVERAVDAYWPSVAKPSRGKAKSHAALVVFG